MFVVADRKALELKDTKVTFKLKSLNPEFTCPPLELGATNLNLIIMSSQFFFLFWFLYLNG